MKTTKFLTIVLIFAFFTLTCFSCSNDDDSSSSPDPSANNLPTRITVESSPGGIANIFEYEYNNLNQIVQETISGGIHLNLNYNYNSAGNLTHVYLNGELYMQFTYNSSNIITHVSQMDEDTGEMVSHPLVYSSGTYSGESDGISFSLQFDSQNRFVSYNSSDDSSISFNYGTGNGIWHHVNKGHGWAIFKGSPISLVLGIGGDYSFTSGAITQFTLEGSFFSELPSETLVSTTVYTRNEDGNVTQATLTSDDPTDDSTTTINVSYN